MENAIGTKDDSTALLSSIFPYYYIMRLLRRVYLVHFQFPLRLHVLYV